MIPPVGISNTNENFGYRSKNDKKSTIQDNAGNHKNYENIHST